GSGEPSRQAPFRTMLNLKKLVVSLGSGTGPVTAKVPARLAGPARAEMISPVGSKIMGFWQGAVHPEGTGVTQPQILGSPMPLKLVKISINLSALHTPTSSPRLDPKVKETRASATACQVAKLWVTISTASELGIVTVWALASRSQG